MSFKYLKRMNIEVQNQNLSNNGPNCPPKAAVAVKNLTFAYSGKARLLDIPALEIQPKQIVSILGPSGCGKTTLMLLLAGLIHSDSQLTIFGATPEDFRKLGGMSVVFQNPSLLSWRTVLGNLRLPFDLQGIRESDPTLTKALALVGLEDVANSHPDELSGGMQSRVALARSLVTNPQLLLMDEPFGNLDEFNRVKLNLTLAEIQQTMGMTVIIITHNIHDAILISDRILIMKKTAAGNTTIVEDLPIGFANKTIASTTTKAFTDLYQLIVKQFQNN